MADQSVAAEGRATRGEGVQIPIEGADEAQASQASEEQADTGGGSTPSPDTAANGRPAGSTPGPAPAAAETAAADADAAAEEEDKPTDEAAGQADAEAADADAGAAPGAAAAGDTAAADSAAPSAAAAATDDAAGAAAGEDAAEGEPQQGAASADDLLAAAAEALTKAQAEAKDWQDKYLRLHAEWDTYRRRTTEQRAAEKARAAEKLVTSLLPVIDDFERTIDYAASNGEAELLDGVKAVHAKLLDVLTKDGVEVIDPAGEAFDALEHQAVATVPDDTVPDETVRDVYQRGYRLGAKVLRPAMVTVTTGGPKRPKEEEQE